VQILDVLIDTGIRTIKIRVMKKMKDYLTKNVLELGFGKNWSRIQDPDPQHLLVGTTVYKNNFLFKTYEV
jgi:hypothetical protein